MNSKQLLDIDHARAVAQEMAADLGFDDALRPYEKNRWRRDHLTLPVLHLEDISGIPFLDGVAGIEEYQHRARVRAGTGDLFAASTNPAEGYEDYCQEHLGLGSPHFLFATGDSPLAVAEACFEPSAFEHLVAHGREAGGMVVHPYMAIEPVWRLARRLAEEAGVSVSVLGPPPPVLWLANDKSLFSRLVERSLGPEWLVETRRSHDPAELAKALGDLSKRCDLVGLKRTRCASAMGNAVMDGKELRDADEAELRAVIDEFLTRTRWCDDEDVLVVEWVDTDLSPSTQLWVPPADEGIPTLDGVYEQILDGPEKVFLGSRPSTLPDKVNETLGQASLQVCAALQELGYVGRCSFDFIVTGDLNGEFRAQFTECNGRWGGTSTPMHLVDRLVPHNGQRPAYVATDYYLPESHRGMRFSDITDALGDDLYGPDNREGRYILYNVGPLAGSGKFDVIALGDDADDAHRGLTELLPEKLGI